MFDDLETAERSHEKWVGLVQRTDNLIWRICAVLLWLSLPAMLISTCLNAALRYLSDTGIIWSEQLVNCLFSWFVMAGAALAAQHSRHIGVQLLPTLLNEKAGKGLQVIVHVLIIFASVVVVWYGTEVTLLESNTYFTLINVSQAWSYLALLVGYTLIGVTSLTGLYRVLQGGKTVVDFSSSAA